MSDWQHEPVLVEEVLETMAIRPGLTVLDGTVGLAGHSQAICERLGGAGRLIGLDLDADALVVAERRLAPYGDLVTLRHESFEQLAAVAAAEAPEGFDAILLDLGVSKDQLTGRFSFSGDAPLDFRLDPTRGEPASALLARLDEAELSQLLTDYGEERFARRIARGIVEARRTAPLRTTDQLVEIVRRAYPPNARHGRLHVATRTLQALRIAVNRMLEALAQALRDGPRCLRPGGRMGIIAFHSLEDRAVKHTWRALAGDEGYELVTRKPLFASEAEVARNPGARSARLRVLAAVAPAAGKED